MRSAARRGARIVAGLALAGACASCHARAAEPVHVFVTNEDSGDVSVLDAARDAVVATVRVGKRPRGLRMSPDHRLLYVAVSGAPRQGPVRREEVAAIPARAAEREPTAAPARPAEHEPVRTAHDPGADGIAVVDLARGEVVRRFAAGRDPDDFDVSPDGRTLYVSNEEAGQLTVLDAASGAVHATVRVGDGPEGVAVSRDGRFVYVACEGTNEIVVLEAASNAVVRRVPTGTRPHAVAFPVDGTRALVTAETSGTLDVLELPSHASARHVRLGAPVAHPTGVALAPNGEHAWVANGREGSVVEIDLARLEVTRRIHGVGTRPWGMALTPDGKKLYVAAGPDVAVVDVASARVAKRIRVGDGPRGVVVARRAP